MRVGTRKDSFVKVALKNHEGAIKEAMRRGISFSAIADQFGVSPQGVQDYCKNHGLGSPSTRSYRRQRKYQIFSCAHCGAKSQRRFATANINSFCSPQCTAASKRIDALNSVVFAISERLRKRPWPTIAKQYGCRQQTLQRSIFQFLHANGLYSAKAMDAIWRLDEGPHSKSSPKYKWLTNQTDILSTASLRRYRDKSAAELVAALLTNTRR